jgi:phage tail-like protein
MAAAATAIPFTTFNFLVEITLGSAPEKLCDAAFAECDGLEMTLETRAVREGGRNAGPVLMAGAVAYAPLTLRRGMSSNADLWTWFERVAGGERGLRASVEVVMLAADRASEQTRFVLTGCVPTKLRAAALNARDGLLAVEEMQIAYESLTRRKPQERS